jgi:hypothetical protein
MNTLNQDPDPGQELVPAVSLSDETLIALRAGRALIADPQHWTTGALAKDDRGRHVSPFDKDAVCWCSIGALKKVTPSNLIFDLSMDSLRIAIKDLSLWPNNTCPLSCPTVDKANDGLPHQEVLRMWDRAIEIESQSPGLNAEAPRLPSEGESDARS